MKKHVVAFGVLISFGAVQAQAQTVVSDTDGNGTYSIEELQAAYPDLNEATFASIDVNADGQVDADELQAAREAGTIAS